MDVRKDSISGMSKNDVAALASAIYGEARNQGTLGKAAVGYTALTRSQIGGVPVADVVYGSSSKNYGQYSFANPKDPNAKTVANAPERDPEGWAEAMEVAKGVLSGEIENPVPGATNYKTPAVSPAWADVATPLGKVGGHQFYSLPDAEIRSVVRSGANSPYRREDLVSEDQIEGGLGMPAGTYEDIPDMEGNPTTISRGEFDFTGPRSTRGFGRMTPETQHVASEMARTLPEDERMTVTATHGEHGLRNLTHTPGAAFDVRTRDKTPGQLDAMVDSALYSRPAAIGYNSGAGAFPAHMHVDTNAGYGAGLQSTSELSGLSDYAKQELARYDEEMKSGLGYTPPVPESIAPVPEARPTTLNPAMAQNAIDSSPYREAPAESGLSGGLSAMVDASNPNMSSDGVPISRVQSMSIRPGDTIQAPEQPSAIANALSSISPIGNAYAGTPPASASTSVSLGDPFSASATGTMPSPSSQEAYASVPLGASTAGALAQDLPSFEQPIAAPDITATSIGAAGLTPGATSIANISPMNATGLASAAGIAADATAKLSIAAPSMPDPEITPEVKTTLPELQPVAKPVTRKPATISALDRFPDAPEKDPVARASDVWSGNAAEGVATDGSKLSRNPDGSISRYSDLSGKTEKVGDSIAGWGGPSIGDTKASTGGFWSGAASSSGTLGGGTNTGGKSFGQSLSDFFGGGGKGAPTQQNVEREDNTSRGGLGGFFGGISDFFGGLGSSGSKSSDNRSQIDRARDPNSVGLY